MATQEQAKSNIEKLQALLVIVNEFIEAETDPYAELPETVADYHAQCEKLAEQMMEAIGADVHPTDLYDSINEEMETLQGENEEYANACQGIENAFADWIERPDALSWRELSSVIDTNNQPAPLIQA